MSARLDAWRERAACISAPIEVFYPDRSLGRGVYHRAKAFCDRCEVREDCLACALDAEGYGGVAHRAGMFGGLTPPQRAKITRPRVCPICETEFVGRMSQLTCSAQCLTIKRARYRAEWHQQNRASGHLGGHGSMTKVQTGCGCVACRGRRRVLQREGRLRKRLSAERAA